MNDKPKTVTYEVIANFPASMFEVGEIVTVYENTGMLYMVEISDNSYKDDVRDYPHLFRKVEA